MKINRIFLPAFLAILLLLSQQMGYAHAVSHFSDTPNTSHNKQLPIEQACAHCLAFAQIGSALTTHSFAFFADIAPGPALVAKLTQILVPRTICAFRSRAPPALM